MLTEKSPAFVVHVLDETPVHGLTAMARRLHCCRRAALRYILHGTGDGVRLEAARIGPRWVTSRQAIERFLDRSSRSYLGLEQPAEV